VWEQKEAALIICASFRYVVFKFKNVQRYGGSSLQKAISVKFSNIPVNEAQYTLGTGGTFSMIQRSLHVKKKKFILTETLRRRRKGLKTNNPDVLKRV
jgi:hypothetical protein